MSTILKEINRLILKFESEDRIKLLKNLFKESMLRIESNSLINSSINRRQLILILNLSQYLNEETKIRFILIFIDIKILDIRALILDLVEVDYDNYKFSIFKPEKWIIKIIKLIREIFYIESSLTSSILDTDKNNDKNINTGKNTGKKTSSLNNTDSDKSIRGDSSNEIASTLMNELSLDDNDNDSKKEKKINSFALKFKNLKSFDLDFNSLKKKILKVNKYKKTEIIQIKNLNDNFLNSKTGEFEADYKNYKNEDMLLSLSIFNIKLSEEFKKIFLGSEKFGKGGNQLVLNLLYFVQEFSFTGDFEDLINIFHMNIKVEERIPIPETMKILDEYLLKMDTKRR